MAVDVGSAVGYLDLDISGFLSGLKTAQSEANSVSKNISSIGTSFSNTGKTITSVGTTLTKNVSIPLLGIGTAGLKVATDFEKGMSEVKAISGATGKDFDALRDKAIELGGNTAFSANEVASAMTEMAKAGWSSQQIIDGMGGVLNAAAASGENLGTVSTIVADAITGFGMKAKDSTRIADLLTQAANSGTIGINDLGESFKYVAPVAGAMNLSVEDTTTALAAMSKAGIKGSQAGTSLKNLLTNLVHPVGQAADAVEALGINVKNSDGSMKSLDEIVGELRTSFDGLTDAEKAKNAAMLAGKEGMPGLLALLNLTEDEYNQLSASMDNAGGVAEETAKVMQDNLASKIEQLGGSLESLAIKLADLVIPYIKTFVEWLTGLVDKFTSLDTETQKTILKFAALAIAAGPIISIFGKVVSGVGMLFTAFGKLSGGFKAVVAGGQAGTGVLARLGGAFASITAPIAIVIGVVAILASAFVSLWRNNEEFRTKIIEIWTQVKETFSGFIQGIIDRVNSLGFNFTSVLGILKAIWQGFCNFLAPIFVGAFQLIATAFTVVTNLILGIADVFINLFKGNWQGAWDAVKGIFVTVWSGISAFFTIIWGTIRTVASTAIEFIKTTVTTAFNAIKTTITTVMTTIRVTLSIVWDTIKTIISTAIDGIKIVITNAWTKIRTTISNTINGIKSTILIVFNSVKTIVTNTWDSIKLAITTSINSARNNVVLTVNGIKTSITNGFNEAKTTVFNVFESIKTTISNAMDKAKTTISDVIEKIKSLFDIDLKLNIKLPHISISGGEAPFGIGGKGKLPSFSVEWYKKAMTNGMILNSPTIFGFDPKTGNFLGGGEAGSETVVGTNSLLNMIRQSVIEAIKPIVEATHQIAMASAELGYVTYNGFVKQSKMLEKVAIADGPGQSGGDTFIFNSPKAIDEIEAARQMKKTKRDMAEGF